MALNVDGLHMGSHASALSVSAFAYVYARRNAGNALFSFGTGKVNALRGDLPAQSLCLIATPYGLGPAAVFQH
jgi:Co/Zn/Cd efflux system component